MWEPICGKAPFSPPAGGPTEKNLPVAALSGGKRFHGWPDVVGLGLLGLAGLFLLGSIDREIDYDEANYLQIAKSIARTGLPYLRGLEDIGREEVFITSPPLVMAVAALTQAHWPGRLWPSRLVHVLVFSWSLYLLVWWISRRLYGPWPACFALAVLLSHTQFLGHASVVRLDVPLGLWSLASLWCFYRALEPGCRAWLWSAGAAVSLAAATAAKFQAICIPIAIGLFLAGLAWQRQWPTLVRAFRPIGVQCFAGLLILGGLYYYLIILPGPDAPQYGGGLLHTTQQLDTTGLAFGQIAAYYVALPIKAIIYVGWPLWIGLLGLLPGRSEVRFAGLLASYCVAVGVFNLAVAKLCGAGTYYLISMIPALAVLGGRAGAVALEKPLPSTMLGGQSPLRIALPHHPPEKPVSSTVFGGQAVGLLEPISAAGTLAGSQASGPVSEKLSGSTLPAAQPAGIVPEKLSQRRQFVLGGLLLGLLVWQWLADRPWEVPWRIPAGSRLAQVAQWLNQIDPAGDGVLAEDTGIQFFSDRPTTVLQFAPYEAVQMYLEGRGPYPVSFVVLRATSWANPDPFLARHWPTTKKLLDSHFQRLPCPVPGMVVFVRKGKLLQNPSEIPAVGASCPQ
ncbi:MAG: glycosyltransferase family 39 protein [Thermoguttaceae bacterium]|nr:glycosyltransferase family 39 protein [Thermoguttaceae bacterium]MDW8039173.1 glycosyltransferase family 39 protein [Thermoguttaceae bacterium]